MIYREFLKRYSIRLGAVNSYGREGIHAFSDYALANGWKWWNEQPFRDEGLCHDSATGKLHRFTTHRERRNRLDWCIYTIGPEVEGDRFISFPPKQRKELNEGKGNL